MVKQERNRFGPGESQTRYRLDSLTNPVGTPGAATAWGGVQPWAALARLSPPTVFSYWLGAVWDEAEPEGGWLRTVVVSVGLSVEGGAEWHTSGATLSICRNGM